MAFLWVIASTMDFRFNRLPWATDTTTREAGSDSSEPREWDGEGAKGEEGSRLGFPLPAHPGGTNLVHSTADKTAS